MIPKDYEMAYTEVIEILKYVPDEDIKKIPIDKIEFYKTNMDKEYKYELDITKEFKDQKISEITKAILANIFRDYWATPLQKEKIMQKEKYDLEKLEEKKRKKYNPDELFRKDTEEKAEEKDIESIDNEKSNLPMEVKKNTFFQKLISFIKGLFNKNN